MRPQTNSGISAVWRDAVAAAAGSSHAPVIAAGVSSPDAASRFAREVTELLVRSAQIEPRSRNRPGRDTESCSRARLRLRVWRAGQRGGAERRKGGAARESRSERALSARSWPRPRARLVAGRAAPAARFREHASPRRHPVRSRTCTGAWRTRRARPAACASGPDRTFGSSPPRGAVERREDGAAHARARSEGTRRRGRRNVNAGGGEEHERRRPAPHAPGPDRGARLVASAATRARRRRAAEPPRRARPAASRGGPVGATGSVRVLHPWRHTGPTRCGRCLPANDIPGHRCPLSAACFSAELPSRRS